MMILKQYTNASGRHCQKQLQFISAYPINSGKKTLQLNFGYIQDSLKLILSMPQSAIHCSETLTLFGWNVFTVQQSHCNQMPFSNSCYSTIFEVLIAIEV